MDLPFTVLVFLEKYTLLNSGRSYLFQTHRVYSVSLSSNAGRKFDRQTINAKSRRINISRIHASLPSSIFN